MTAPITAIERDRKLIEDIRELIMSAEAWQHNATTRRIDRLIAEYDDKLEDYRDRMKRERERELGLIAEKRDDLNRWEQQATAKYADALSGHSSV